jgi:DNA-binding beta-propeller fold protein YncE
VSEESGGGSGEFSPGSQVAGYRLEEQIGQGGMAVVFRAYDQRLDRQVALKILAPGLALDEAFRQRFIRESRAAAAVDDPHIIPVFEAGEERGVLFIAMRYVRGGDVRSLVDREGPLPPGRATEIISQVASALDAAHARGLVHRDVKPANMLLDESAGSDRPDHVYLSDFGLTKAALAVTGLTSTGQFLGTLDYVAPEQIEGRPVDGRTDLYALACATFELLTGAPPFRRDEGMAVMYAQVSEEAPRLSSRRPGLPARADAVMSRALAKSPDDRYPSCRDFAGALRHVFGLSAFRTSGPSPTLASPSPSPRTPTQASSPSAADPGAAGPAGAAPPAGAGAPGAPGAAGPDQTAGWGAGAAGAGGADAAASAGSEAVPGPLVGPPTQAASIPGGRRATRPGQTEPRGPGGTGGDGAGRGYGGGAGGGYGGEGAAGHPRPWWRSRVVLAVAAVVIVVAGGGAAYALAGSGSGTGSGGSGGSGGGAAAAGLTIPGCTTATPPAKSLDKVPTDSITIGGNPFAVRESKDHQFTFATVQHGIAVLRNGSGTVPALVTTIHINKADKGLALTKDGKYMLAAGGSGAVVINVAEAEQGVADPVVGRLKAPQGSSAVGVVVSPDSKFAFVTLQATTHMAVFNLAQALSSGFGPSDFVGFVPLGVQPVGLTRSDDGKWLYVSSFQRKPGPEPAPGTLSLVSMSGAETDPAHSVKHVVDAGCSPARITTDGTSVWVTARDSNAVLGYSADKLVSDPQHALVAVVKVGPGPIGIALTPNGQDLVVADSNQATTANGNVAVISTSRALAGKPALLGVIPAEGQPRQLTIASGGKTVLVTLQATAKLMGINVSDLP